MTPADTIREALARMIEDEAISTDDDVDALRAALAALTELEQELRENERLLETAWGERDAETEKAMAAEADRDRLNAALTNCGRERAEAQIERDRYREALERLAGWQPHTPRGLDELHPQHIEAILDARAALATPEETT